MILGLATVLVAGELVRVGPTRLGPGSLHAERVAVLGLRAGLGLPVSRPTAFVVIFTMSLWSSDRESVSHGGAARRPEGMVELRWT